MDIAVDQRCSGAADRCTTQFAKFLHLSELFRSFAPYTKAKIN